MMQSYVERQLTSLHYAGSEARAKDKIYIFLSGLFILCLLPYLHIGVFYYIWAPDKPRINKRSCSCDCFDTVFRGRYEWPPAAYKHVYFNATYNSMKIWFLVILGVLASYECIRYILPLIQNRNIRLPMLVVFLSSIYPHYYGWWGFFNYWNEEFYSQWHHQMFFSVTEIISTIMVVHLCNRDNRIQPWKLLVIIDVNLMHIIVSCLDQFIKSVIYHQGTNFENVRNYGLMVPDLLHVLVPFFELQTYAEKKNKNMCNVFYKEEVMISVLGIVLFSILGKNL